MFPDVYAMPVELSLLPTDASKLNVHQSNLTFLLTEKCSSGGQQRIEIEVFWASLRQYSRAVQHPQALPAIDSSPS